MCPSRSEWDFKKRNREWDIAQNPCPLQGLGQLCFPRSLALKCLDLGSLRILQDSEFSDFPEFAFLLPNMIDTEVEERTRWPCCFCLLECNLNEMGSPQAQVFEQLIPSRGEGTTLMEKVHHWGQAVRAQSFSLLPVHSLCFVLAGEDVVFLPTCSCLHACCSLSMPPRHDGILSFPEPYAKNKLSSGCLSHDILITL